MREEYPGKKIIVPDYLKAKVSEEKKITLETIPHVTTESRLGGEATVSVSKRKADNLCTIIGCIVAVLIIALGILLVTLIASVPDISYLIFAHISLVILIAIGGICTGMCSARHLYLWLTGEEMEKRE